MSSEKIDPQAPQGVEAAPDDGVTTAEGGGETRPQQPDAEATVQREVYLRLAAEYDNFRKRTERERGEAWVRAQAQLLEKLLDPLDDLQRVADYTPENTTVQALLEGMQLMEKKLFRALEAAGLVMVGKEGEPFDPTQEEALMTAPTERPEEDDTVGQVLQTGYHFKGILLRPARVLVKKYGG